MIRRGFLLAWLVLAAVLGPGVGVDEPSPAGRRIEFAAGQAVTGPIAAAAGIDTAADPCGEECCCATPGRPSCCAAKAPTGAIVRRACGCGGRHGPAAHVATVHLPRLCRVEASRLSPPCRGSLLRRPPPGFAGALLDPPEPPPPRARA